MASKKLLLIALVVSFGLCALTGCNTPAARSEQFESSSPFETEKQGIRKQLDRKYSDPGLHYQLAQVHLMEGASDDAEYEYKLGLNFDPAHRPSQAGLVKLLIENGRAGEANTLADRYIQELTITTERFVSSKELIELGRAFEDQLLTDMAQACYEKAIEANPGSALAHKLLGLYYLSQGEKERAKESLIRSFELDSNQPEVSGELGKLGVTIKVTSELKEEAPQPTTE